MIYPELDLNLLDLLVLRRAQVRLFIDTGQVSNSAGAVYDPRGYAVGAGVGFAAVYDFMGFFPSLAYIEIATRADRRPGDVQFLFGTRQSF
jgi:hemolysin activation/secretion protein